jgi:hypothetical protein
MSDVQPKIGAAVATLAPKQTRGSMENEDQELTADPVGRGAQLAECLIKASVGKKFNSSRLRTIPMPIYLPPIGFLATA